MAGICANLIFLISGTLVAMKIVCCYCCYRYCGYRYSVLWLFDDSVCEHVCLNLMLLVKKVREKSRECHNHKPQPFPDPKRKRKSTNLNKHKPNKRTKSTKISSLFPKRGNRNTKRTGKHKNKMTHGKTYNKSPRSKSD